MNEDKMMLSAENLNLTGVQKVQNAAVKGFMNPQDPIANVVGVGLGIKWTNAKPTGKMAIIVMVSQKLEADQLNADDMIPSEIGGIVTDVMAVGTIYAGGSESMDSSARTLNNRVRPAKGGYSVGHYQITAGTIGTSVYDILPGGKVSPPVHGTGIPSKYYILSNNHVLANSNAANIGDPILQPGPYDGGTNPADRIAALSRFIPITFQPPVPLQQHNNLVDAAVAEGQFSDLNREIYWIGNVRGWRRKMRVNVGLYVKKTGRTTNLSIGRIVAINATVDVNYGGGNVARFKDQFVTTNISAGGDSGSLVTTLDNVAVGLLFAGSSTVTVANHIENVRSLLRVEVAEEII